MHTHTNYICVLFGYGCKLLCKLKTKKCFMDLFIWILHIGRDLLSLNRLVYLHLSFPIDLIFYFPFPVDTFNIICV